MMKSERLKPKRLKRGDTVAVVSLSWGGLGDEGMIHRFFIAKDRLEQEFGLKVVCMEHALKGSEFIDRHPELPIFYNVNFGHAKPIAIIPYGIEAELNCENKTIRFLENPTI